MKAFCCLRTAALAIYAIFLYPARSGQHSFESRFGVKYHPHPPPSPAPPQSLLSICCLDAFPSMEAKALPSMTTHTLLFDILSTANNKSSVQTKST
jgi:hypothetical protein